MADLISATQVTDRLGPNVTVDTDQVAAYLADVSAQARKAAGTALDAIDSTSIVTTYPELVPVLVGAIRRYLTNPDGFGSEMLDGYRFEQAPKDGVQLSKDEKDAIRDSVGVRSSFTSVALVTPWNGETS